MTGTSSAARWVAITVFVFSAVLNYLDRQVLATMVDIWRLKPEFPFSYEDYGLVLSVFSLAYALAAPFMGWFLDRAGLNRGISISVAVWAVASIATGFAHSVGFLLVCRAILGVAEASGVSAVGKAVGMYLRPPERGRRHCDGAARAKPGRRPGSALRGLLFISVQLAILFLRCRHPEPVMDSDLAVHLENDPSDFRRWSGRP